MHLLKGSFVLLTRPAGTAWRDGARSRARDLGVPLEAFTIGADLGDPDGRFAAVYGVQSDGAALVRPDGHVGWRSRTGASDPGAEIDRAVQTIVGRVPMEVGR